MILTFGRSVAIIALVAVITFFTRAFPFIFFGGKRGVPKLVGYIGRVLPSAIIAALVVYCVKDVKFTEAPYGAAYLCGIAVTALLHILFRKTLVSIVGGTVAFMVLSRLVFI